MLEESYPRRWRGYWKEGCIALGIFCAILLVALVVVSSARNPGPVEIHADSTCDTYHESIDLNVPEDPPVFADLTKQELQNTRAYLKSQPDLNLVDINKVIVSSSYIYSIELLPPTKSLVLQHLDNGGEKPKRWAKVIIFRGDLPSPLIQEYRVGPMPQPSTHALIDYKGSRKNPIPFAYRPLSGTDIALFNIHILPEIFHKAEDIIVESFGAKLRDCGSKCMTYSAGPVSTSLSGEVVRKFWVRFSYALDFMTLHPLDFQVLVNLDGVREENYRIEKVWYNQKVFNNLEELGNAYRSGKVEKLHFRFPKVDKNLFSTLNLRGDPFPKKQQRRPFQTEPDGRRYTISGQRIKYMGWSFNYRMSTNSGPMLFDVRYKHERIAYEISLQEIAVFYSGFSPASRFSDIVDSASMIGILSKILIPEADCPGHATFLPATHLFDGSGEPVTYDNALCLFELETGNPLRRHHSFSEYEGHFYEGLMDDVLVLRTVLTVGNYDYIFDYIFHQNGVVEVKVMATGYILASTYSENERQFGFQIHKNVLGNIHHHMFNFKVDMDIFGTSNRFETLDISVDETPNGDWSSLPDASVYNQLNFKRTLRQTELQAAYKFDFSTPKYLLFHNEKHKTTEGVPRAYRIAINGMSKQLLPEGKGHEPSVPWSRYQMAVTKFKQTEVQSSSVYAIWDSYDPVNDFQSFLDDDEDIVDEVRLFDLSLS